MRGCGRTVTGVATLALVFCEAGPGIAAEEEEEEEPLEVEALTELSLRELADVEVTTPSRRAQKRSEVAAALYVITAEDIRRAGVRTLADALRLAPGVHVARVDANKWAIGLRGFGSRLSRSVLVLVDGRSAYTPFFAGTWWEVQDVLLEDIERIEVIRGPGGALWGANAVNGVVNIITRSADETQGGLLSGGGGTEERYFGAVRAGLPAGERVHYRFYGKLDRRDGGENPDGPAYDEWEMRRAGFRLDADPTTQDRLTVQGDGYLALAGQRSIITGFEPPSRTQITGDARLMGANLLTRWTHRFAGEAQISAQAWWDVTSREEPTFTETRHTADVEAQAQVSPFGIDQLVAGVGVRVTTDDFTGGDALALRNPERVDPLYSAFLQEEVRLFDDTLRLSAGAKLEHNAYSGFEVQPNGRVIWLPSTHHAVWAAVTRAVRTPSRIDHDVDIFALVDPQGMGTYALIAGREDFESETVIAYEAGYRLRLPPHVFVDLALFFNSYDDLTSVEPAGEPFVRAAPVPHLVVPHVVANGLEGETYGGELSAEAAVTSWFRLEATWSLLWMDIRPKPGAEDPFDIATSDEDGSPRHQATLRTRLDLPYDLELDAFGRYVGEVPGREIDAYATVDVRAAWRPAKPYELAVVGQNLAQARHREAAGGTLVQRGVYGKLTWRF